MRRHAVMVKRYTLRSPPAINPYAWMDQRSDFRLTWKGYLQYSWR
jgi:hypothetical protein